jgi:hypothetical protein
MGRRGIRWQWPCLVGAVSCLFQLPALRAEHAGDPEVVAVDSGTWYDAIIASDRPSFVFFQGPGDPDATGAIMGELAKLSRQYAGIATVATVDCGQPAIMEAVCREKAAVPRVPHMRVYAAERKRNPYKKNWYKEHKDYTGGPEARQMSMALQTQLVADSIAHIGSMRDWENWADEGTLPQVRGAPRPTPALPLALLLCFVCTMCTRQLPCR